MPVTINPIPAGTGTNGGTGTMMNINLVYDTLEYILVFLKDETVRPWALVGLAVACIITSLFMYKTKWL